MVAKVFLLLLIVLAICRGQLVIPAFNNQECDDLGGVCTPINRCKSFNATEMYSCPNQISQRVVCCKPSNVVVFKSQSWHCNCVQEFDTCVETCSRKHNRIIPASNDPECDYLGGVCTPMEKCKIYNTTEMFSCPNQISEGKVCCNPSNVVDTYCGCSEKFNTCIKSCNPKDSCYWLQGICIPKLRKKEILLNKNKSFHF